MFPSVPPSPFARKSSRLPRTGTPLPCRHNAIVSYVKGNLEGQPCTPGHTQERDGCIPTEGSEQQPHPSQEPVRAVDAGEELAKIQKIIDGQDKNVSRRDLWDANEVLEKSGSLQRIIYDKKTDSLKLEDASRLTEKQVYPPDPTAQEEEPLLPWDEPKDRALFKEFRPWGDTLSGEESQALANYNTILYQEINGFLRGTGGENFKEEIPNVLPILDSALNKGTTQEDFKAHRAADISFLGKDFVKKLKAGKGLVEGFEFEDAGYTSTTINENYARSFGKGVKGKEVARLSIRIPKGSHGGYMPAIDTKKLGEGYDVHAGEYEFLLPRGGKFRVTGTMFLTNSKTWIIEVDYLGSSTPEGS